MTARDTPLVAAARAAGVSDPRILDAVASVPRAAFVRGEDRDVADTDRALATSDGQTTSQPSLIAQMLDELALRPDDRVLELGTGPGYQAALLARLVAHVVTIEVVPALADVARITLAELEVGNVEVVVGDGRVGHAAGAPYDAIVVAAASDAVPPAVGEQLVEGGRLIAPIGDRRGQRLQVFERVGHGLVEVRRGLEVRFVPLIGDG